MPVGGCVWGTGCAVGAGAGGGIGDAGGDGAAGGAGRGGDLLDHCPEPLPLWCLLWLWP